MKLKELTSIEKSFFDFDEEHRTAKIVLDFEKPGDIFDRNYVTKMPVLSDEFLAWIKSAFDLVSPTYKIDLTIRFDTLEGYTDKELRKVFDDNIELEFKSHFIKKHNRNMMAVGLIVIGLAFFVAMLLINRLWNIESVWKDIVSYVSDIATTVTFWEAMTILIVEQKESTDYLNNLHRRFSDIQFTEKKAETTEQERQN